MRIAVCADTHVPSRADGIPEWVREELRSADHVVHAGDFDSPEAYDEVADLAPELTAVRGNMDSEFDADLPETATVELDGVLFVVTHGTGPAEDYRERVAGIVEEAAGETELSVVGVSGHTHQVLDETVPATGPDTERQTPFADGVRLLNPGSATGADPATRTTMLVLDVEDGAVDVRLVER
ncbi:metallophosphoesterase family protein [Halomarina oriensis]|uniref:Phosphoesterase n=1 Tax=Halomarina oriensis TaxID=671145 RepID=A0A6B0GTE0_9EURY|nr:metallophosphoesterase family protein [Halomarina oriensis]MWG36637.1 YfcE family phosphodiesterase [Halomarina oriensis]